MVLKTIIYVLKTIISCILSIFLVISDRKTNLVPSGWKEQVFCNLSKDYVLIYLLIMAQFLAPGKHSLIAIIMVVVILVVEGSFV